jgi:hypothetical protein
MRFRITGAHRDVGVEKTWEINCDSIAEALQLANAAGYFVSEAEPIAAEPTSEQNAPTFPARIKAKAGKTAILVALAMVVILVAVLLQMASTSSAPEITGSPPPAWHDPREDINNKPAEADSIGTGDHASLKTSDGSNVLVARSKDIFDRLSQLAAANDNVGIKQMIDNDEVFQIESGTASLVIDRGLFSSEVRISDGDHSGESGWVNSDLLHK